MAQAALLKKSDIYDLFSDIKSRYRLLGNGPIGSPSGFGVVWKARDNWLGVDVAIKISDSDLSSEVNFCREIDRETVRVFDFYKTDVWFAYAMELLAPPWIGLSEIIKNREYRRGDVRHYFDCFEIVNGLLRGVSSVHGKSYANGGRFVHADIKPDNIFVRIEPRKSAHSVFRMSASDELIKIIDLGVSVRRGAQLKGFTPAYSPPYETKGTQGVDLYAIAVCFLELVTGVCPAHDDLAHKAKIRALIVNGSSGSRFVDDIAIDFVVLAKNAVTQQGTTTRTLIKFLEERLFNVHPLMLLSVQSLVKNKVGAVSKSEMVEALFPVFARYFDWINNTQRRREEMEEYLVAWRKSGLITRLDGVRKYSV